LDAVAQTPLIDVAIPTAMNALFSALYDESELM
jgi:hypothetical protein